MKLKKLAIAGVLILVSGIAFAAHDHDCGGKGKLDKAQWQERRAEHFEKHQAELHDKLTLSAEQETAWKILQGQIKPPEKTGHPDAEALSKLNTLQRLDRMEAWDKERDSQMAERSKAIRTFYAQLSDSQKKVFDENAFPAPHKHPR